MESAAPHWAFIKYKIAVYILLLFHDIACTLGFILFFVDHDLDRRQIWNEVLRTTWFGQHPSETDRQPCLLFFGEGLSTSERYPVLVCKAPSSTSWLVPFICDSLRLTDVLPDASAGTCYGTSEAPPIQRAPRLKTLTLIISLTKTLLGV